MLHCCNYNDSFYSLKRCIMNFKGVNMIELIERLDIIENMLEDKILTDKEFEFLLETKEIIQEKIIKIIRQKYKI